MTWQWLRIRRWALLAALAASAGVLVWRIRAIRRAPRVEVSDRVASLIYLRLVSQAVYAYAQRFGLT